MHHHLPLQLALQYRAEDAGVHGLDAVVAEDEVPVGGQGAGIGQVITLGGAFAVGVGLVLGLAVYEEPAILKVYFGVSVRGRVFFMCLKDLRDEFLYYVTARHRDALQ